MALRFFQRTTVVAALLSMTLAQTPNIIPSDLSAGFNNKEVQVSFSAEAVDGFASGTTFEKDAVTKEPTFALGDSNGISPSTRYTLIMVDTTCTDTRKLHYVRSNFKFSFAGGTNIETDSPPLLDYKAPGALGEQGDDRQYVFLMYTNPQRREFTEMQLPRDDDVFDVNKFQDDNGLKDAVAGVGMVVKLGGTADCAGGDANQVPSGLPAAAPTSGAAATNPSSAASPSTAPRSSNQPESAPSIPSSLSSQPTTPLTTTLLPPLATSSSAPQTGSAARTTAAPATTSSTAQSNPAASPTSSSAQLEQTVNAARVLHGHGAVAVAVAVAVIAGTLY